MAAPLQAACPAFTLHGTKPAVGNQPLALNTADLNNDNKADIVTANTAGNNVSVLLGNGDGTFATRVNYSSSGVSYVVAADFNGDNKADLAISGSNLYVRMNTGTGAFGSATNYFPNSYSTGVAAADFNGDSKIDIATSNYTTNDVSVFLNNGTGIFASPVNYPAHTAPYGIVAGDVTGDGKQDLVVVNRDTNDVSLLIGNGNGTFVAASHYSVGAAPFALALGDFNADGRRDVVTANHDSLDVSVRLGNSGGLGGVSSYPASYLYSVTTGDFNADSKVDIAAASVDSNAAYIFLGTGSGSFGAASSYSPGGGSPYPDGIGAADFNGDGKLDFATANYGTNNVSILLNACTASPTITQVSPASGPSSGGQVVTITGTTLTGATSVTFGGTAGTITNNTATSITVTTPAHAAGLFDVVVTAPAGTVTATNAYTYNPVPTITSIVPSSGPVAGSQSVVINGTNLGGASSVTFGGSPATITNNTASAITVTTPAHAVGAVNVVVTATLGTVTSTNGYTYVDPPTVTSMTPTSGPAGGGQAGVVINGTNLTLASSVTFGGTTATITNKTATTVTVTTPAHAAGAVDVIVTTPGGTATLAGAYTYIAAPTISSVTPNAGPTAGEQTGVVVAGTNLSNATSITFGGTAATITNNTATAITVTTPAHSAGLVNVVVTTPGGTVTSNNAYRFTAPPSVSTVSPSSGPAAGGQTGVVISGTTLSNATGVTFGGTAATITSNTATAITVTTPAHAAGAVDVVVTTAGGSSTKANGFTYIAAPTITGVAPNAGPIAGGQTGVVISGTDLSSATSVTLGGTTATITNNTSTAITVTTPAHAAGAVNVVVTTAGGSATSTNGYTYAAPPTITGVSPGAGPTAGGQTGVVISGTNLSNATNVTFGGTGATITNNTSTAITVTTPAHAAGAVNVVVTTAGGSVTSTNGYTYVTAPTLTTVVPNAGPAAGGQTGVVISGSNLSNATSVTFGGTTATITNNTAGSITVTTPAHAAGTVDVVVTTAGGSATSTNAYTYVPAPGITTVAPGSGPTTGGQTGVVISGTNLSSASSVTFGGTAATITNNTAGSITVTTPAHAAGAVNVVVATTGGSATATNGYTYVAPPSISLISPNSGPATGGQTVVISGTDLGSASSVTFGGTPATITNNTAGSITVTTPIHAIGPVTVVVTTIGGTDSDPYTYVAGTAVRFVVSAPGTATAGVALSYTVTALDALDNTATGYSGTVHFTSSDGAATLPPDSTLTSGTGTFNATLHDDGVQTITATDGGITGTSNAINVAPAAATHFNVSAPASATAGVAFNFTVTALDAFNNTATGYSGTAHFTSTDGAATLPSDSTLTNGAGTFSATLRTAGNRTITAADGGITGTSNAINVSSAAATHFTVSAPGSATAGVAFNFTVTALDTFNNVATGYNGTAHFTSSDGAATLPSDSTLTNGTGTFSATLRTVGNRTITAADGGITGTSSAIDVNPAAATHFNVSAPASATAGVAFNFTVTALDAFNNVATGYSGSAHFTSTDGAATLPADSTLTNGNGTFSATLRTAGNRTITAADGGITDTSNTINVAAAAATHFAVSAPGSATAGVAFNFTVTALDAFNNTAIGYSGSAHFTSSDGAATLPSDSTLTNGTGSFSATLRTAGIRTITAADGGVTGTSNAIDVDPAAATHFTVSAPGSATAGVAFNFTVTALDAFNNTATGYSGTAHFTSTDGAATLPSDSTLTNGVSTFSATLRTAGSRRISAADGGITGTSSAIDVAPAAATHFSVSAPASANAGVAIDFTVTALDAFSNTATGYSGTAHFTSSDGAATLPSDSTLTNGVGTFSATLRTAGIRTITAADAVITGTSNAIDVAPAAATHFTVSAPGSAIAGAAFNFTVTALDAFNNTATGYSGTAHFTSTDAAATLPSDTTLTNGTGTFSATLRTAGIRTITASDGGITGTSNAIDVAPAAATHFNVSAPASATAGVAFNFTVTALDAFNNTSTGYSGTAHFTSTDGAATLPADSTLTNGAGTFSATLRTTGNRTITAADGGITGTSSAIDVAPAAATHFNVSAPGSATAGASFTFTVTALDAFDNTATGYSGTAHFTSSDGAATLPADATLTSGAGSFTATLRTAGNRTITATDAAITGTSVTINVNAGSATRFAVSAPATAIAGAAFNFTVTALDAFGNPVTGYAGTAHFTSSDAQASLPADAAPATFAATLRTASTQTITATDGAITGTSNPIDVAPAVASRFTVSAPGSATAGVAFNFATNALDAFGNLATGYNGTVHFTSSDSGASLPSDSTLTNGSGSFNATLRTAGSQTISTADGAIIGTSNAIDVTHAAATHFTVSAPATAIAGSAFPFTVTALDAFNNTATGYSGTAHFTSSDGTATLPADATLTNGTSSFSATLRIAGSQTIGATDASITGTSGAILVAPGAVTHFSLSAPGSATAGSAFPFTVTPLDAFENAVSDFAGTVHYTSTDANATLPSDGPAGTLNATLRTAGTQTLTATSGAITGISKPILVAPAAATHFTVSAPASATAGVAFSFTVTALDAFNNTATSYSGSVHFTSGDAQSTLPSDSTLANGIGSFSATMRTAGSQTVLAADGALSGNASLNIGAAAAAAFVVEAGSGGGISTQVAGTPFAIRLSARDAFGNVDTTFTGVATLTANAGAISPLTITFAAADGGVKNANVTLTQSGNARTITASASSVTGTSGPFVVDAGALHHFRIESVSSGAIGVQTTNVPFGIRVTALDANDNVASFGGTAVITSTGLLVSGGGTTASFNNGILASHLVAIGNTGSVTLTATNSASSGTSNAFTVGAASDLSVALSGTTSSHPGEQVSYVLVVRNAGPSTAHAPVAAFALPASWQVTSTSSPCSTGFPCTLADLEPSQQVNIQIVARVATGALSATYDVAASATSTTSDPVSSNNHATVHTVIATACPTETAGLTPSNEPAPASSGTLRWAANGAQSYEVYFGAEGSGCTTLVTVTSSTSLPYQSLIPGKRYEWRVVAKHPGCPDVSSECAVFEATSECVRPDAIVAGAVAEISSGAAYHVTWTDVDADHYELQETAGDSFTHTTTIVTEEPSLLFRHDSSDVALFSYRVRPIVPCAGELPFSDVVRVVVQPLQSDGRVVDLSVETGSTDTLSQVVHVDAPAGTGSNSQALASFAAVSDQPWLTVDPPSGTIPPAGIDLTLTARAANRLIGTSVATVHLATTDGVTLHDLRVNLHVSAAMTLQPRALPVPANVALLPAVAHAPGASAFWQSDVRIFNASNTAGGYQLSFTPSGVDGTLSGRRVEIEVPAGATIAFDDIVRHLFGYGALAAESAIGSLEIRPMSLDAQPIVTSRTYAVTPGGTYGQAIPAFTSPSFASPGETLSLQHLAQSSAYRTNVGLIESSGNDATAQVRVYDDAGHESTRFDISLRRLEQRQFNAILAEHGVTANDARIEIGVTSSKGLVGAYASVVDNLTSDPNLVPAVKPALIRAMRYVVPGIADFTTGRNNWRSDVRIYNASAASVTANILFFPQGSATPVTRSLAIGPGEVAAFDDFLRSFFAMSDTGGAVHVVTPTLSSLVITARTYDAKGDGTYGQFIPAVTSPDATGFGERALEILHVEETAAYRANIGFVEVDGKSARVEVTAMLADGRSASTVFDLAPNEFRQIGSMLRTLGFATATNARLSLRVIGGAGRVTGYASIIDNLTGDPTYMQAQ